VHYLGVEIVEEEILKIVLNYSKSHKLADINFVEKIFSVMIADKKLHNYLRNISDLQKERDKEDKRKIVANYDSVTKIIGINFSMIGLMFEELGRHNCFFDDDCEKFLFKNLEVVQILLHEVEHAKQYKKADLEDNDIETKLILASFDANPKLREQFYDYDPMERLADIKSFKTINKIVRQIEKTYPTLSIYEKKSLIDAMLNGYVGANSPTIIFLDGTHQLRSKVFPTNPFFVTLEKFMYGLPVQQEELDDANQIYNKLCRKLHKNR